MRWDRASDKYLPVSWEAAFRRNRGLKAQDPKAVVLYLCGHAALETAYMYQLFGRMLGTNNLPMPRRAMAPKRNSVSEL
jgi:anaerobic selenocysteine-containing dehydrogenase